MDIVIPLDNSFFVLQFLSQLVFFLFLLKWLPKTFIIPDDSEDLSDYSSNTSLHVEEDEEDENFLHSETQESSLNISSVVSGKFCCRYCKS